MMICQVGARCTFNQAVSKGATSSSSNWNLVATASAYAYQNIMGAYKMGADLKANFQSTAKSTYHAKQTQVKIKCSRFQPCYIYQCNVAVFFTDGTVVSFNGPVMQSTHKLSI